MASLLHSTITFNTPELTSDQYDASVYTAEFVSTNRIPALMTNDLQRYPVTSNTSRTCSNSGRPKQGLESEIPSRSMNSPPMAPSAPTVEDSRSQPARCLKPGTRIFTDTKPGAWRPVNRWGQSIPGPAAPAGSVTLPQKITSRSRPITGSPFSMPPPDGR